MAEVILNFISNINFAHIIYIVYGLNTIIALGLIFFDRKTPAATLAWIMIMFLLPYVGLILYLMLSQNIARKKIYKVTASTKESKSPLLQVQKSNLSNLLSSSNNSVLKKWNEQVMLNLNYADSVLTYNDSVDFYYDGKEMFESLCDDIRNAKYSIKLEYYILKDDFVGKKFIALLTEKARSGVKVKLLLDALGSRRISASDLREFEEAGGEYALYFKPYLRHLILNFNYRNHRKIAIIDNEIAYTGGFNIAKEYLGYKKKFGHWRDTHTRIKGNSLGPFNEIFYLDWNCATNNSLDLNYIKDNLDYSIKDKSGNIPIQVVSCGPESPKEEIKLSMMKMITGAKKKLFIQTPYLVPDEPMIESICMAARSGVDVRIMIPCMPDHIFVYRTTLYNAGKLIDEGVKVFIYDNGFLHAKTLSADGEVSTIGSCNFDIRSFRLNFETNAFIYDKETTGKLDNQFIKDLEYCHEYTKEDRNNISVWEKILESISRLLTEVL